MAVGRFEAVLRGLRLPEHSTLAIMCHNSPEWLFADWAAAKANLRPVGVHGSWPLADLAHVLCDSEARAIVVAPQYFHRAVEAAASAPPGSHFLQTIIILSEMTATSLPADAGRAPAGDTDDDSPWPQDAIVRVSAELPQTARAAAGPRPTVVAPDRVSIGSAGPRDQAGDDGIRVISLRVPQGRGSRCGGAPARIKAATSARRHGRSEG